jgi:hypothetical protein
MVEVPGSAGPHAASCLTRISQSPANPGAQRRRLCGVEVCVVGPRTAVWQQTTSEE